MKDWKQKSKRISSALIFTAMLTMFACKPSTQGADVKTVFLDGPEAFQNIFACVVQESRPNREGTSSSAPASFSCKPRAKQGSFHAPVCGGVEQTSNLKIGDQELEVGIVDLRPGETVRALYKSSRSVQISGKMENANADIVVGIQIPSYAAKYCDTTEGAVGLMTAASLDMTSAGCKGLPEKAQESGQRCMRYNNSGAIICCDNSGNCYSK